eukprot:TRINITY_DN6196_c0_g1_i1.p2 TRINITY_DN6196_c0_g1~~TRINITY_DN6196_c0_g1_i1.p2  ORF type:complete len:102 (+),score=54.21 TRINITY_DN6196_c0_g1_i1:64-369(+)
MCIRDRIYDDLAKIKADMDLLIDDLFCDFLIGKMPFEIEPVNKELFQLNWITFDCTMPWVGILNLKTDSLKCNFSAKFMICLLYTSPSPRDKRQSRMPSSA